MTIIRKILLYINAFVIIAMLVTGYSDRLNPETWSWMALGGYVFPVFVLMNLAFIVFWMVVKVKYVLLPFIGMVLAYQPVMNYCPVNLQQEAPEGSIRVMSYNTLNLGTSTTPDDPDKGRQELLEYIASMDVDIVCLQEAMLYEGVVKDIKRILKGTANYVDTVYNEQKTYCLAILSRYPIVRKERIDYESQGNMSCAFTLDMNGHLVTVVNNHLESNAFSQEEKENFHAFVHSKQNTSSIKSESKFLAGKLSAAAKLRAPQARAVSQYIRRHNTSPVIVCGDFNDIPISYAHRTIAQELIDCYTSTGFGPGFSYGQNSMRVRIDNIMCSPHFTPYGCEIDDGATFSDHYPIVCSLKMNF